MKTAIIFCLFVSFIFSQTVHLNIGGTTCIPDAADTCTPVTGSSRVTVTGGVTVGSDNTCAAGAADTAGVSTSFTTTTDGFFTVSFRGLGENADSAVLVFAGAAMAASPCDAVVSTGTSWTGFLPAGTYTVVVTSNGGAADACGEFGVTVTETVYQFTGTTDTPIVTVFLTGGSCYTTGSQTAFLLAYTPTAAGAYTFFGVGRQDGADTGFVSPAFVIPTASLSSNLTDAQANCNASSAAIAYDATALGYVLEAGTEYTVALYDADTTGTIMVWANANMAADVVYADCDNMDYTDQADWMRPNIPATSIVTECVEGSSPFQFDVRQTSFDTDQFVVVDTVSCANPDDTRSNVDGAVVLYYGALGSVRDATNPAVAPEPCVDFIIGGDSGDGGAVFYWFPANADLTIVPTTYSSGATGKYTLTIANYDIVGCVPANPYLEVPTTGSSNMLAFVASALIFIALL